MVDALSWVAAKRLARSCERALVFSRLRGEADEAGLPAVPLRCGLGDLARAGAADFERGCNDMS